MLAIALLPFVHFAIRDNVYHFRLRRVSRAEHLLHLLIGLSLAVVIGNAFLGRLSLLAFGLVLFTLGGALDEYVYHRELPAAESDVHAKQHLALLIFVIAAFASDPAILGASGLARLVRGAS